MSDEDLVQFWKGLFQKSKSKQNQPALIPKSRTTTLIQINLLDPSPIRLNDHRHSSNRKGWRNGNLYAQRSAYDSFLCRKNND